MSNDARMLGDPDVEETYVQFQNSPEFAELKSRFRRFVFPWLAVGLIWYSLFVLASVFAHDFMATKLFGNITVGLVFGLLQIVSTFVITGIYLRWADRDLDPRAAALADRLAGGER